MSTVVVRNGAASDARTLQLLAQQATVDAITDLAHSRPPIVCYGDSITDAKALSDNGFSVTTQAWTVLLASDLGAPVVNRGASGSRSYHISARQGGKPFYGVPDGQIPATRTAVRINGLTDNPIGTAASPIGVLELKVTLAGVAGVLKYISGFASEPGFIRDVAGAAITVPLLDGRARVHSADATDYARNIQIIWSGYNNPASTQEVLSDTSRMVGILTPPQKRFLVLSLLDNGATLSGTGTARRGFFDSINNENEKRYGSNYVDIRKWLIDFGLSRAGLTATAGDTTDIAANVVPRSLRFDGAPDNGDPHPNVAGNAVIASFLAQVLREKGWV